ncbi:hypothetical protein I553_9449 [Mycobacterium xenopi 4042]|uniref:Transposase DDE domain-containing protein n=1 Tax=Mycobacterium xenopi 4042 TaxID=1299334 RepID=X8E062_MYCXE|nr:hypothetical protein I553_9449 [Mycobacterium xenopi 4042]
MALADVVRPQHRVMRYRASPVVCNSCPVKATCTTSDHGREITREIDPWPYSDAGRFHRGIACFVAALGVLMPLAMLIGQHTPMDVLVLGGAAMLVALSGLPWRGTFGIPRRMHRSICRTAPDWRTRRLLR